MQLVEQHVIRKSDARYEVIDQAAFASKHGASTTICIL
jgi:hypothetical protein